ncbi:MAG: DUF3035 domain-containing protein [Hyphomicrobiales bacterium]|nr:DUF3035 domain-containing protein [Hyphomicrobiales bacterium]
MRKYFCISVALAMMALSGCENVKNVLSFPRGGPDEFAVTTNQPLAIPPDYNLRPPDANANATTTNAAGAAETLFQGAAGTNTNTNNAESSSLTAGEEAILRHLEELAKQRAQPQAPGVSASGAISSGDPVVDALEEAKRIESGESGGTPVIEGTKTESIFGNFWDFF